MRGFINGIMAAILTAGITFSASAQTREDAYIATRDAAIAQIKAAADVERRGSMDHYDDKVLAAEEKARAGLEQQMRTIVGPVAIKGMPAKAAFNLDTLIENDDTFGLLDGMVYGAVDAKTRVIVTTDNLLRRWLVRHKDWWGKDSTNVPQEPSAAVKESGFYTQAVMTDAAIVRFAELPIRKPAGAAFGFAMLAARTQDRAPDKADEIFVALAQGGKVFVAYTKEFNAVGPAPACAVAPSAGKTMEEERNSDMEFLRCFAEQAPRQNGFAAAVQAAQALADRLPAR
jgi:hypothetical protein